jgi:hypothetical protein
LVKAATMSEAHAPPLPSKSIASAKPVMVPV